MAKPTVDSIPDIDKCFEKINDVMDISSNSREIGQNEGSDHSAHSFIEVVDSMLVLPSMRRSREMKKSTPEDVEEGENANTGSTITNIEDNVNRTRQRISKWKSHYHLIKSVRTTPKAETQDNPEFYGSAELHVPEGVKPNFVELSDEGSADDESEKWESCSNGTNCSWILRSGMFSIAEQMSDPIDFLETTSRSSSEEKEQDVEEIRDGRATLSREIKVLEDVVSKDGVPVGDLDGHDDNELDSLGLAASAITVMIGVIWAIELSRL